MNRLLKIALLLIAIFPLWLTIVAMAEAPKQPSDQWRMRLNERLLKLEERRIQIIEFLPTQDHLSDELLSKHFQIDLSQVKDSGNNSFGVKIVDDEGRLTHYAELKAKLLVQIKVPVATRDLRRGSSLDSSSFEWRWMDSSAVRRSPATQGNLLGKSVRSYIGSGQVIYSRQLETGSMVKRGERVRVHVVGQGIRISTFGVAQESGREGETIKILNIDSKKDIYGVITGSEEVEVRL